MTRIVQRPSPETVSALLDYSKTTFSLETRLFYMQLVIDALSVNQKTLSWKCDKAIIKMYSLKIYILL